MEPLAQLCMLFTAQGRAPGQGGELGLNPATLCSPKHIHVGLHPLKNGDVLTSKNVLYGLGVL